MGPFLWCIIQSPSPRRRRCSKSSSCSDVASIPPHTSTLTLSLPSSSGKKNIMKISDISRLFSPASLVKVTQVSTQDLLAHSSVAAQCNSRAAAQCNSLHNALHQKGLLSLKKVCINALLKKLPSVATDSLHCICLQTLSTQMQSLNYGHKSWVKIWRQKW